MVMERELGGPTYTIGTPGPSSTGGTGGGDTAVIGGWLAGGGGGLYGCLSQPTSNSWCWWWWLVVHGESVVDATNAIQLGSGGGGSGHTGQWWSR